MPQDFAELLEMKVDAIVVLGAAVWRGGCPSPSLRRRVSHAVELFRSGVSDNMLMSGGLGKYQPSEAVVMRALAVRSGVPETNIIIEDRSTSTFENVQNSVAIMTSNGWRSAIVVTDVFHIPRSLYVFRSYGMDVTGSAPANDREHTRRSKWIYYFMREVFAFPCYVVMVFLRNKRLGGVN